MKYITKKQLNQIISKCDEGVQCILNLAMQEMKIPKRQQREYAKIGLRSILTLLNIKSKTDILRKARLNNLYA